MWTAEAQEKHQFEPADFPRLGEALEHAGAPFNKLLEARRLEDAATWVVARDPRLHLNLLVHVLHMAYLKRREAAQVLPRLVQHLKPVLAEATTADVPTIVRLLRKLRWHEAFDATIELAAAFPLNHPQIRAEHLGGLLDASRYEAAAHLIEHFEATPSQEEMYYTAALGRMNLVHTSKAQRAEEQVLKSTQPAIKFAPTHWQAAAQHLRTFGVVHVSGLLTDAAIKALEPRGIQERPLDAQDISLLRPILDRPPLGSILQQHLGDHLLFHESYFKTSDGRAGITWHQDGRTTNEARDYVTCWVPLNACGRKVPALEVVAWPFRGFFPFQEPEARPPYGPYRWTMDHRLILPETVWAPDFTPGDVLIFGKYAGHRTQSLPLPKEPVTPRRSMDFRVYSRNRLA